LVVGCALNSGGKKAVSAEPLPQVLFKTSQGDVLIELYEDEAPNTVANFISLVEKKYYDGIIFHRVIDGFMAQGGDPTGTGTGGPGYAIPCECYKPEARKHQRGTLSMAHAGRDTGGSQFFLTFVATPHLDGKHTVFGQVIQGMENVDKLKRRDPRVGGDADKIVTATVVRKRDHEYKPQTLPSRR
jgi:cyclophilin family peptidyl-prolyl cis-trans isomerase